ncbi:hypothetical protein ACLB2K_011480 [Fragaria x ananassa]
MVAVSLVFQDCNSLLYGSKCKGQPAYEPARLPVCTLMEIVIFSTNIVGLGPVVLSGSCNLMGAIAVLMKPAFKPHNIEALVLWHGTKLCRQIGVTKLAIASDAVNVINAIGKNELDLSNIGGIMDAVRKMKVELES